jgi:hypothetical protein
VRLRETFERKVMQTNPTRVSAWQNEQVAKLDWTSLSRVL